MEVKQIFTSFIFNNRNSKASTHKVWDPDTWERTTKIVTQLHLQMQRVPEDTPTHPYVDPACYELRYETGDHTL